MHRELGPRAFIASIYAKALAILLRLRCISFAREQLIRVFFRQEEVGRHWPDFIVSDRIVVELKAIWSLDDSHFVVVSTLPSCTRPFVRWNLRLDSSLLPRRILVL